MRWYSALVVELAALSLSACEWEGLSQGLDIPADPSIAVSRDYIVQTTNSGWAMWQRPLLKRVQPQSLLFAAGCGRDDKRVYFDAHAQRWYLVANESSGNICVSASQTADPTLGWWRYILPIDAGDADHPTVGWSYDEVIVTAAFEDGRASYVLDKWALLNGQQVPFVWFRQHVEAHAVRALYSTGAYTFAVEAGDHLSGLWVWRFEGHGSGTKAKHAKVDVGNFGGGGPYTEGPAKCDVRNTLYDALLSDDSQHLYVAVDDTPDASIRVFELRGLLGNWPPAKDSSTLFNNPGVPLYFASLGTDGSGTTWVGANCSHATVPLSMCLGWRQDGNNESKVMAVVKLGTTFYNPGGGTGGLARCGDFTTLASDPGDRKFLYFSGQIALEQQHWRTWNMQIGATCTLNPRRCA